MITLDLFDAAPARETRARRTDPFTSHAAAKRVDEFAGNHHALILAALRKHRAGLTVHEIASLIRLDAHQVGKRVEELRRGGDIALAMGENDIVQTRTGPSGRAARVWKAVVA